MAAKYLFSFVSEMTMSKPKVDVMWHEGFNESLKLWYDTAIIHLTLGTSLGPLINYQIMLCTEFQLHHNFHKHCSFTITWFGWFFMHFFAFKISVFGFRSYDTFTAKFLWNYSCIIRKPSDKFWLLVVSLHVMSNFTASIWSASNNRKGNS